MTSMQSAFPLRSAAFAVLWCIVSAMPAHAASVNEARTFVDTVGREALDVISSKVSKEQKEARLEKLFSGSVDIPWVGRFTLGHYWREATDAQRSHYLKAYEDFWVTHYARRFAEYSGGSFKITGASQDEDGEYTVTMTMTSAEDHQDVQVEYHVHVGSSGRLQIYDIVVEGVSMITTQRSEFASVVGSKGLDYLIDQLANRTLEVGEKS